MSNINKSNEDKLELTEVKKEDKQKKELSQQEIQKRKKMLIYPLFFLLFIGAMWLIFAHSSDKNEQQLDGFNSELPIPKDEAIVGDKRTAYEQEAMRNKQKEKMRSLQDFAFMLGEEESRTQQDVNIASISDNQETPNNNSRSQRGIESSAYAYQDVNRQLTDWYEKPATNVVDDQAQLALESRINELEKQLEEKSTTDQQLELIEKSYAIAAKYMPNGQGQVSPEVQQVADNTISIREKAIPKPVSQVHHSVVSLLVSPIENDEFLEQYSKPRNMGFITATSGEVITNKNSIKACVYQTVTLSDGKELQLRLLEPMRVGDILVPLNTVMTGSAKISSERLQITITSIQYADNVIPVEIEVYDTDGIQGIFVPNSDEINAVKEIAANMGTSMGSSITITDDAGSQLAADLGRSVVQGASQFFSKKMREVKITLKSGYKVLLIPKA